jgi:hypothetical protein
MSCGGDDLFGRRAWPVAPGRWPIASDRQLAEWRAEHLLGRTAR